jgi:hypothetical protein
MTSAAPPKPTITALKTLFLTAFTEFLLNISASLEVSITSIRFIVFIDASDVKPLWQCIFLGVSHWVQIERKGPLMTLASRVANFYGY